MKKIYGVIISILLLCSITNVCYADVYSNELKLVSTSQAFNELIQEKIDIVIATKPSNQQIQLIEESKLELEFVTIAREPLIFYTVKSNKANNLSIRDIQDIYNGNINNWSSLGGKNKLIITYQLESGNGSQTCLESQ